MADEPTNSSTVNIGVRAGVDYARSTVYIANIGSLVFNVGSGVALIELAHHHGALRTLGEALIAASDERDAMLASEAGVGEDSYTDTRHVPNSEPVLDAEDIDHIGDTESG